MLPQKIRQGLKPCLLFKMNTKKIILYGMFFLIVILHILDIIFTFIGVGRFGFWIEKTEWVRTLFKVDLIWLWVLVKIVIFYLVFKLLRVFLKLEKYTYKKLWKVIYNFCFIIILITIIFFNDGFIDVLSACIGWIRILLG